MASAGGRVRRDVTRDQRRQPADRKKADANRAHGMSDVALVNRERVPGYIGASEMRILADRMPDYRRSAGTTRKGIKPSTTLTSAKANSQL